MEWTQKMNLVKPMAPHRQQPAGSDRRNSPARKRCQLCLYRIGFGFNTIGRITATNRALVRKRVIAAGLKDTGKRRQHSSGHASRKARGIGGPNGGNVKTITLEMAHQFQFADFKRERRAVMRQELLWKWRGQIRTSKRRDYERNRRKTDPAFKAKFMLRKRVRQFMQGNELYKHTSTSRLIGCTLPELKRHIESKFKRGMTWENHGSVWELDHVIPLAAFDLTQPDQLKRAAHFTNCQPLSVADNRIKRDHVHPTQQALLL